MMQVTGKEDVKILVVDDEDYIREVVRETLQNAGYSRVDEAEDGEKALELIRKNPYDVVITDLRLPGVGGETILKEALTIFPETIVIVMTGFGSIQTAVDATKMGAFDFLPKPVQMSEMVLRVDKGVHDRQLKTENNLLRSQLEEKYQFSNLVGNSAAMRELYSIVSMVAPKNSTALITGETGTGKELIARAIHYNSPRRELPLVSVNCGAIPGDLLEDELFGHVKGAYTGATQHRVGRFEQANRGTLFLDEIGTIPLDLQVKLLRALQEKEIQRVGGTTTTKVDVRIIAATNSDLLDMVRAGRFREDLYYRLNVIPIHIVPLRERRDDIPLLVSHFLKIFCAEQNVAIKQVSPEAIERLIAFDWPGNVRQLRNAVEMAVALSGNRELLQLSDFPIHRKEDGAGFVTGTVSSVDISLSASPQRRQSDLRLLPSSAAEGPPFQGLRIPEDGLSLNDLVSALERQIISQSLEMCGGNKKRAATLLNLKRTTLVEKIKRLGLESAGEDQRQ
jgi:DNA-binding NtrC family response regulator